MPVELGLKTSQKNELLRLIQGMKFDPFNFKWNLTPSQHPDIKMVPKTDYVHSDFFFQFDINIMEEQTVIYSPGNNTLVDEEPTPDWSDRIIHFEKWLNNLRKEISEPDLWAQLEKYKIPIEAELAPDTSNDPLTAQQYEEIVARLNEIRAHILGKGLASGENEKLVNERIDYLIDAAKRQGRRDWFHTCIGVFVTITVALALEPEAAKAIWTLVKALFGGAMMLLR